MSENKKCLRCDSFDTYEQKYIWLGAGALLTTIGIFVWPLLIVSIPLTIIGVLRLVFGFMFKSETHICNNCHKKFVVPKRRKR